MTTATPTQPAMPAAMGRVLGAVDRVLRARALLRGVGLTAFVLGLAYLVATGTDLVFGLHQPLRVANLGLWSLLLLGLGGVCVAWPLVRPRRMKDLAALFEQQHPETDERLSSAVAFLEDRSRPHGSPALVSALVDQAETHAGRSAAKPRVVWRSAATWAVAGGLMGALCVFPALLAPDPFARLGARFFRPWSPAAPVSAFSVQVAPGDTLVLVGDDLEIRAGVGRRFAFGPPPPDSATLLLTSVSGRQQRVPMLLESAAEGTGKERVRHFKATLRGLAASLHYRVASGALESASYRVEALEPPGAQSVRVGVAPPAYTGWPARDLVDPATVAALQGSAVTLIVTPNRAMRRVTVDWPAQGAEQGDEAVALTREGQTWRATLRAARSGAYRFKLEDEHGLVNRTAVQRQLRVVEDQAPELALEGTDEAQEARGDDLLVVGVAAHDDIAVAGARIAYEIVRQGASASEGAKAEQGEQEHAPIVLEGLGTAAAAGQAGLNLKPLGLRPGDELRYEISVWDNRPEPEGPNVTRSQPRSLRIRDNAQPLATQLGRSQRERLRAELARLRKAAAENQQAAAALRYAADAALRGNGVWQREQADNVAALAQKGRQEVEALDALAQDFADSGGFEPLAEATRKLADVEAEGARQMLERARQATETRQRLADLRLADARLAAVGTRLDELQRRFDELAKQADDVQQLRALAEREEELSRRAAEAAQSQGAEGQLDALRHEQETLRNQVDELVRRTPELRAELTRHQARQAQQLARQARALAARQREEEQTNTEGRARLDKLRALAAEQQAIVDDARKLALEVDLPLQENGRGHLNLDALARPVDPLKRGDTEPALQHVGEAANELRRLKRELVEVQTDDKLAARRLAKRQDELAQQTANALRQADTPEKQAALAKQLAPLAEQQAALAGQAVKLGAGMADQGPRKALDQSLKQAAAAFKEAQPDAIRTRQAEARDALNRLADTLPEAWQTRQQAQQRVNEARGQLDAVARDLEQHLREADARASQQQDAVTTARELSGRVEGLVSRQREAARGLQAITPTEPDTAAQRDRAVSHANRLADDIEQLRASAPPETDGTAHQPVPAADWHVLGTFDMSAAPPFPLDRVADFKAVFIDKPGRKTTWKPVRAADQGVVDLHAVYGRGPETSNAAAFASMEYQALQAGSTKLALGSDDTVTVWLNGQLVFDFQGRRSFAPAQDTVDVALRAGANRFVVRCGNGDADWKFSLAITPLPNPEASRRMALFESRKRQLDARVADARAGLDRLAQALEGRQPADARADELAQALTDVHKKIQEREPVDQVVPRLERIEAGLRALEAGDAALFQGQAVRAAAHARQQAAEAKTEPQRRQAASAVAEAVEAARSLAQRLDGSLPEASAATTLARALEGPAGDSLDALSRRVAGELSRLPQSAERVQAEERVAAAARPEGGAEAQRAAVAALQALARSQAGKQARAVQAVGPTFPAGDAQLGLEPAHHAQSHELARRQQEVADQLRASLAERVEPQQALRGEAGTLKEALSTLRDEVRDISQSGRAQSAAQAAADTLQHRALPAMDRSVDELAHGRVEAAREAQRQAADQAEQAARHAADLAASLRAESPQNGQAQGADEDQNNQAGPAASGNLQTARRAQSQAAQALARAGQGDGDATQRSAFEAAQAMKQAAQGLRAAAKGSADAAKRLAQNQAGEGGPNPANPNPDSTEGRAVSPHIDPLEATRLERSARRWGELPGHLREEMLQLGQRRYRPEYARLIQLYFREIANEPEPASATDESIKQP